MPLPTQTPGQLPTCHGQGYSLATPVVTREGGLAQFRADLRTAMQTAGIDGTPIVFYVEDHQVCSHMRNLTLCRLGCS
jgi:P-loop containing dynein motor region D4